MAAPEQKHTWGSSAPVCLDKTEVTVEAYARCVNRGECTIPERAGAECNWHQPDRLQHPINCVTYAQAVAFCESRDARLPTEGEFVAAMQAGSPDQPYPWGSDPPDDRACWRAKHTCPVGSYRSGNSADGISDLSGNVSEWTATQLVTPANPYALKGGDWAEIDPVLLRADAMGMELAKTPSVFIGFRCASE